jgi:hypothetical protein
LAELFGTQSGADLKTLFLLLTFSIPALAQINTGSNSAQSIQVQQINDFTQNLPLLVLSNPASGVDYFTLSGSVTGNPGTIGIQGTGTDTNISVQLTPKGTGQVIVPSGVSANPTLAVANGTQGWNLTSTDACYVSSNAYQACFRGAGGISASGNIWGFAATSNAKSGTIDTGISRDAAAIVDVGNGTGSDTSGTVRVSRIRAGSLAPTCTFTSGGGSSPSCSLDTGSTDSAGIIIATTGTGSPAGTGTITLTFSSGTAFGSNKPACIYMASDGGAGQWNGLAVMKDKTPSTTTDLFTWTNGTTPTTLSTSTAYWVSFHCWAK